MMPWWDTVLAVSALERVEPLVAAAEPAWVWTRDGARVLWANPAGGSALGAAAFPDLAERRWPADHPLRRGVERLAGSASEAGQMARLRIRQDAADLPLTCRCHRIRPGGERALLVVGEAAAIAPALEDLASFFSSAAVRAAIFDAEGACVAGDSDGEQDRVADMGFSFLRGENRFLLRWRMPVVPVPLGSASLEGDKSADGSRDEAGETPADSPEADEAERPAIRSASEGMTSLTVAADASSNVSRLRAAALDAATQHQAAARAARPNSVATAAAAPVAERDEPSPRPISAGRVARVLSRKPVRFLWQTDSADRFLFLSPGLSQVVGRNADIVGERWQDAAARLQLDPAARIERALGQRDTWSGLTAWWPVEGSNVRVPAELTALPIFAGDHSFQGYRGFGVLKPAEALMPAAFDARFGPKRGAMAVEQVPPYEEEAGGAPANVVPIRADLERQSEHAQLSAQERNAFDEIAAALRGRVSVSPVPDEKRFPAPQSEARAPAGNSAEPAAKAKPAQTRPAAAPSPVSKGATSSETPGAEERKRPGPADEVAASHPRPDATSAPLSQPSPRQAGQASADADLQRSLRELTAVLDTATDGVIMLRSDGAIESANGSAEALFGLRADELRGLNIAGLLTQASGEAALDYLAGLRDNGVATLLNEGREVEAAIGSGRIPLFMTMGRISGDGGGRFCAVLRDITHWKRTEAELVAAKRSAENASLQKSEFLARVSHEIRTPLNAIIGFAEVMIEERFGPIGNDRYREYLRDIRTSGEHVVSLVNDLLDISKIESGKLDLDFGAVPLNDLVRECIALMQPQANRAHVVLRSSVSRDVPAIVGDTRTLRQIVLNLLSNSVKFTNPGGQVIASTSLAESGEAILRIRDTGEGMTEAELARAMEPFRQIATATLSDRTGSGLGLPLTKALVEANRASLDIRSARGEGTVATVTFPATRVLSE